MSSIIDTALSGLNTSIVRTEAAASQIAQTTSADVSKAIVEEKSAALDFQANVAVIKVAAENDKRLMDVLA